MAKPGQKKKINLMEVKEEEKKGKLGAKGVLKRCEFYLRAKHRKGHS